MIDIALCVLDQGQHIAHVEDAGGHAIGIKALQSVHFFAGANKFDRFSSDVAYGKRCATARVAIQLGQDDAGQRESVVKSPRCVDCILPLHGIDDKQGFDGFECCVQRADFGHHGFVDTKAPRSVDY